LTLANREAHDYRRILKHGNNLECFAGVKTQIRPVNRVQVESHLKHGGNRSNPHIKNVDNSSRRLQFRVPKMKNIHKPEEVVASVASTPIPHE
jgi:hypothetical protein